MLATYFAQTLMQSEWDGDTDTHTAKRYRYKTDKGRRTTWGILLKWHLAPYVTGCGWGRSLPGWGRRRGQQAPEQPGTGIEKSNLSQVQGWSQEVQNHYLDASDGGTLDQGEYLVQFRYKKVLLKFVKYGNLFKKQIFKYVLTSSWKMQNKKNSNKKFSDS